MRRATNNIRGKYPPLILLSFRFPPWTLYYNFYYERSRSTTSTRPPLWGAWESRHCAGSRAQWKREKAKWREQKGGRRRGRNEQTGNSDGVNNLRVDFPPMEGGCARIREQKKGKKRTKTEKRNTQLEVRERISSLYLGFGFFFFFFGWKRFVLQLRVWIHFWIWILEKIRMVFKRNNPFPFWTSLRDCPVPVFYPEISAIPHSWSLSTHFD